MGGASEWPRHEGPYRILFVFGWLVVGGEETELRLLAKHIDRTRYQLEVVACFWKPGMPVQAREQLQALGVPIDETPYSLSFEDTVAYLATKFPQYDLIVACQGVPDVYPALERVEPQVRPPLIEHGGLVQEALAGPKHLTSRYIGVCRSIRDAAAQKMSGRAQHAQEIPSMVDLAEYDASHRSSVRAELGVPEGVPLVGWIGRLDRKKRVEDFIQAAVHVRNSLPEARFVVVGGPDAFMPEYAGELRTLAVELGLGKSLAFLGDRADVPRLLAGLDVFVWLSRNEGMPHVISEAGAVCLPVVATRDNGSEQQITHGVTGLFVPHESPLEVASAITSLLHDRTLARRLGQSLRHKVEREYSTTAVVPMWEALFEEVIGEARLQRLHSLQISG
jgi:glycosyltransferase involved in cell wall biosynthesis